MKGTLLTLDLKIEDPMIPRARNQGLEDSDERATVVTEMQLQGT